MDFFNKAKESITSAGKDLTQKATDAGGLAKVTLKLKELEREYNDRLKTMGEALYTQHYEEIKSMCPDMVEALDRNRKEYEQDRKEQAVLKGMRICPNCGAEQDKIAVRCTVCGINMNDAQKTIMPNTETSAGFCPKCGNKLVAGAKFCMSCGTQL
ncbi:MAG: zinc ribbon domain-containing protein [Lachnospiraceae bacterium]|nr:zinc ribbon domain-containing protein [Lachnospiraceae bacterium]